MVESLLIAVRHNVTQTKTSRRYFAHLIADGCVVAAQNLRAKSWVQIINSSRMVTPRGTWSEMVCDLTTEAKTSHSAQNQIGPRCYWAHLMPLLVRRARFLPWTKQSFSSMPRVRSTATQFFHSLSSLASSSSHTKLTGNKRSYGRRRCPQISLPCLFHHLPPYSMSMPLGMATGRFKPI